MGDGSLLSGIVSTQKNVHWPANVAIFEVPLLRSAQDVRVDGGTHTDCERVVVMHALTDELHINVDTHGACVLGAPWCKLIERAGGRDLLWPAAEVPPPLRAR